jgi:hypothetical protein
MYARVAIFEGAESEALRRSAGELKERAAEGPPPGVPAKGFTMLMDPDSGRSISIVLFDTEEDLRTGDAALNEMNPTSEEAGRRTTVETYEVAIDLRI